jgi:hypothetical protein
MGEDGRAVALDMFIEPDAGAGLGHDRGERGLADLKRTAPQVIAVQLGNAVVIAGNRLAIDDAGPRAQAGQRLDDQQEAAGEVVAGTAIEPHLCAGLAGNDAKAVVLDLVQALAAGGQLIGLGWEARRDEPGREGYAATCEQRLPWLKIEQFVTAITAKARHSGYAMRMYDEKGETL